eukprot:symbB.v1.2.035890.t1/scaffold4941.1/size32609/5
MVSIVDYRSFVVISNEFAKKNQDVLPEPFRGGLTTVPALRPVGRLDAQSVGLLLLTDSSELGNRLTGPGSCGKARIKSGRIKGGTFFSVFMKEYLLRVTPLPDEMQLARLREGVRIADGKGKTTACTVSLVQSESSRGVLRFVIHEGRNRQLRRMCKAVGLDVEWLMRTRIGPLSLGSLPLGDAREATVKELELCPASLFRPHVWKVYVPEMVFGHLLTSDNYDDTACKVVGGRNGYGAKLANVFSTEFNVETCDGKNRFSQVFQNNMQVKGKPEIKQSKEKSFTCITFKPDLAKFGMTKLDDDICSLLSKRVYDIAGSTLEKCAVHLNGEKLDIKNFRDYCDLYLLTRQGVPQIYEKCSDRWEICVSLTESGFNQ